MNRNPPVIEINDDLCVGCGLCAKVCPAGAILLVVGKARVNPLACTGCGHCFEACRSGAIRWRELRRKAPQEPFVRHGWHQSDRFGPGQEFFRGEVARGDNDLDELKRHVQDLQEKAGDIIKRIGCL